MDYNTAWSDYNNDNSSNTKHRIFTSQTREKKKKEVTFNFLCIPESFNTNISHQLFDYTITFENLQP